MERITIEVQDDGRVSVTAESPGEQAEQMDFESVDEAADAVEELLLDAGDRADDMGDNDMDMEGEMAEEPDMEAMWNEEAAARPPQRGLMA
jgi:hypothetical protein